MDVTAVIVTHESSDTVGAALEALQPLNEAADFSAMVVDNASSDNTPALVRAQHPWVTLIENDENLGFARAVNRAVARAATRYVLLLNPDAVVREDALRKLILFLASRDRAGIAGPALENPTGSTPHLHRFATPGRLIRQALGTPLPSDRPFIVPRGASPRRVDWVSGAVLLTRTSLLKKLQGLDPRFFLYFEDVDLCLRAARCAYESWIVPEAIAAHYAHASAQAVEKDLFYNCIPRHYFESRYYFLAKHFGRLRAGLAELIDAETTTARVGLRRLAGQSVSTNDAIRLRCPLWREPSVPHLKVPADGW
jgi:GT2 family glycosyltransferase